MIPSAFTIVHVIISLLGIVCGFVVVTGLLTSKRLDRWTAVFLWTTVATSVTGFFIPAKGFLTSHAVGILSLLILPFAFIARYRRNLAGSWRWIYVVTAMVALYFNVFVLVVQLFLHVPVIHALAPTQAEPPFKVTQLIVLVLFVGLTIAAVLRFHTEASPLDRSVVNAA